MKETLVSILALASAAIAHADLPKINSINCLDMDQNHKAPVFVDIMADRPSARTGLGLIVGNWVTYSPDFRGKSATVLGEVDEISFQDDMISIQGSFATEFVVNRRTGAGLISAMVKYDPVTGKSSHTGKTDKLPVACTIK